MITPFIERLYQFKALLLHHSSPNLKLIVLSQRATSSKFIIELTKIHLRNSHQIEREGAHNAGLYCNNKNTLRDLLHRHVAFHFVDTIDLAMAGSIIMKICEVVARGNFLIFITSPANEYAADWNLI